MKNILLFMTSIILAQKMPINSATLEDIKTLPLSEQQASSIHEFILFQGPIENIYELGKVNNIQPGDINSLKPWVTADKTPTEAPKANTLALAASKDLVNWSALPVIRPNG